MNANKKIKERIKVLQQEMQQAQNNLNAVLQETERLRGAILTRQGGIVELQKLLDPGK